MFLYASSFEAARTLFAYSKLAEALTVLEKFLFKRAIS